MALILIAVALYGTFAGERIPIRDGTGWDGNTYTQFALDPVGSWELVTAPPQRLQRLLPSLVVRTGILAAGLPLTTESVIAGFLVLNSLLLLATVGLWLSLCDHFKLSVKARWLGFLGLCVNVSCFKIAYYYPTLTDTAALALGMAFVSLFLTRRTALLAFTALLAGFTWPASSIMAVPLLLFPCSTEPSSPSKPGSGFATGPVYVIAGLAASAVLLIVGRLYYGQGIRVAGWGPVVPAVESVYALSLFVTCAYVFIVVASLSPEPTYSGVRDMLGRIKPSQVALALAVWMVPKIVISLLLDGPEAVTISNFIPYTFFLSTTRPGIFLVAHFVYFGPVLLLLPLVWRAVIGLAKQWGPGAQLYLVIGLLLAAGPDSRQSTLLLAMLVTLIVLALEKAQTLSLGLLSCLGMLAFVMSRVWLPFNIPTLAPAIDEIHEGWDIGRYYETQGAYITEPFYLAQLALAGLLLLLFSSALSQPRNARKK